MMRLEGRVALGLDEFMLRLGHLRALLPLLERNAGSPVRAVRALAARLTEPVAIDASRLDYVGEYLIRKRLCVVASDGAANVGAHPKARYSKYELTTDSTGKPVSLRGPVGTPATLWFQDVALAEPGVRSKVGAVTVGTREAANKSGVSHLLDWSGISGIANRRLGLTAIGRALHALEQRCARRPDYNPYRLDAGQRLSFAWLLFMADGDVLARVLLRMATRVAIDKSGAVALILEVAREMKKESLVPEARTSVGATRAVRDLLADLGVEGERAGRTTRPPSTVWHRISSRLEALVDLGFLSKIDSEKQQSHEYEYWYQATPQLLLATESLRVASSPTAWANSTLASTIDTAFKVASEQELAEAMLQSIDLCLGPTGINIDAFAVATASLLLESGTYAEVGVVRQRLVDAAIRSPEVFRLTRGSVGSRAEFTSVNLPALRVKGREVFSSA